MTSNSIAPARTPLTWLNYFDGKFLRAADFAVEQRGFWELVAHSNLADGFGIVWGYDTDLCGNQLRVTAGLGIDATGKVLLLPCAVAVPIAELIASSQSASVSTAQASSSSSGASAGFADCVEVEVDVPHLTPEGEQLWLITVAHAELECGTENVYGQLCASACNFEVERPYLLETVVLRARPLQLDEPYPSSMAVSLGARHLRSRVASAYFAFERRTPPSSISKSGLAGTLWCRGAELADGEVALGVLCRRGQSNLWFDAWTARRERIDEPPRSYWDHHTALRPVREFLAQVLQFQCQLAELIDSFPAPPNPCVDERDALIAARDTLEQLIRAWANASAEEIEKFGPASLVQLQQLQHAIAKATRAPRRTMAEVARILIAGGIVELPPAGYLPVDPESDLSVNMQVRRLLGEGVDPVFCVIRPDDAAMHVLGAQHNDRISLLYGLDHPDDRVGIDILVPDGEFIVDEPDNASFGFRVRVGSGGEAPDISDPGKLLDALRDKATGWVRGAGRATAADGVRFCLAAEGVVEDEPVALWFDLRSDADPFAAEIGASVRLQLEMRTAPSGTFQIVGDLTVLDRQSSAIGTVLKAQFLGTQSHGAGGGVANYQVVGLARSDGASRLIGLEWYPVDPSVASGYKFLVNYDTDSLRVGAAWIQAVGRASQIYQVHDYQRDEAVGDPGDPDHQAALAALDRIAEQLDDPNFAIDGAAALFPELAPSKPTVEIRAKHDWVAFHARHRRECAPPIPVEVVEPNRVYRVYAVGANSVELAKEYQGAPFEGRADKLELTEVGDIEFAPGVAKLETSAADLEDLLRGHIGETRLLAWIGIAFSGAPAAEGGAIAEGRALAVERIVEDVAPAIDDQSITVRAGIPAALAAPGIDGVIVLLTVSAGICHSVYWILPQLDFDLVHALIEKSDWETLFDEKSGSPLVAHLADVDFVDGVLAEDQRELLTNAADTQMGGMLGPMASRQIDALITSVVKGSEHAALAWDHGRKLRQVVANTTTPEIQRILVEHSPRGCDLATFIFLRSRSLAIYAISEKEEDRFMTAVAWYGWAFGVEQLFGHYKAQLIADVTVLASSDKVLAVKQHSPEVGIAITSTCVVFNNPGGAWRDLQSKAAVASVCVAPTDLSVENYGIMGDEVVVVVFAVED